MPPPGNILVANCQTCVYAAGVFEAPLHFSHPIEYFSTQTLAVLISALMVDTRVMDGDEGPAQWLGFTLSTIIIGIILAAFVVVVIKWRSRGFHETPVRYTGDRKLPL